MRDLPAIGVNSSRFCDNNGNCDQDQFAHVPDNNAALLGNSTRQRCSEALQQQRRLSGTTDGGVRADRKPLSSMLPLNTTSCLTASRSLRFCNARACPGKAYEPTDIEQIANILTHALFIWPALQRMLTMIKLSRHSNDTVRDKLLWVAVAYGMANVWLLLVSSVFHLLCLLRFNSRARFFFHMFDRATIYIFIAAAYLPWLNAKRLRAWAWPIRWVIWMSAGSGIAYQYYFHERYKTLETVFYIVHGTVPGVLMLCALETSDEYAGMSEMAWGGALYGIGIIFFKLDGLVPFAHALWHLFVVAAAFVHIDAVIQYVYGGRVDGGLKVFW